MAAGDVVEIVISNVLSIRITHQEQQGRSFAELAEACFSKLTWKYDANSLHHSRHYGYGGDDGVNGNSSQRGAKNVPPVKIYSRISARSGSTVAVR